MNPLAIQRLAYLIFAHLLALILGAYTQLTTLENTSILFALNWCTALALVMACAVDGKMRQKPIPRMGLFIMLFTWAITVPLYCIVARRWWGLLWLSIISFTFFASLMLGAIGLFILTGTDPTLSLPPQ